MALARALARAVRPVRAGPRASRLIPPIWYDTGTWAASSGHRHARPRLPVARVIYGSRISLLIGVLGDADLRGDRHGARHRSPAISAGATDLVVTFLITVRLSLPVILVALTTVALVGSSLVDGDPGAGPAEVGPLSRSCIRSATQQVRNLDYVTAARRSAARPGASCWARSCPTFPAPDRRRHAGDGQRDPARGGPVLPRSRACSRRAFLGPDGFGGEGLHVLQRPG